MTRVTLTSLSLMLSLGCLTACNTNTTGSQSLASTAAPASDIDKYSYALGYQFGSNIKGLNVDLNQDQILKSIKDGLDGKDSVLPDAEMQTAMSNLQTKRMEAQKVTSEKNKTEGAAFLEANKSKEGVKVTESGLQYKVITAGTGKTPKASDKVKVHYKGTLTDGTKFDSSYDRGQPAEFPVGGVIKGWTEALQLMKAGGKWQLFIPSDLAYGPMDRPKIPGNSVLVFDVELLEVLGTDKK